MTPEQVCDMYHESQPTMGIFEELMQGWGATDYSMPSWMSPDYGFVAYWCGETCPKYCQSCTDGDIGVAENPTWLSWGIATSCAGRVAEEAIEKDMTPEQVCDMYHESQP